MPTSKKTKKNKAKKQGRPSAYNAKYVDELLAYFEVEPYKLVVVEDSEEFFVNGGIKKRSQKTRPIPNRMPTLFGFAKKIGVHRDTVNEWTRKHPLFSDALKSAKEMQKEFLITIGLAGAAPPASYIFTAKNVTDMRDKQEVDTTQTFDVTGLEKLDDRQLDEFIQGLQTRVGKGSPREEAA